MQIDRDSTTSIYRQIYQQLHNAIASGAYPPGSKLTSIRRSAYELNCSRNTIEAAYDMLVEEGLAVSRPGSGFFVQDALTPLDEPATGAQLNLFKSQIQRARYDFNYGNLEPGTFPINSWRNICNDIMLSPESEQFNTYTDPLGEIALRQEIAWRLVTQRSMDCTPEQIVIQAGAAPSVQNLLALFNPSSDVICVEEPGYDVVRHVFERNGFEVRPCSVMDGSDRFFADVEQNSPRLMYIMPSSQFPTCKCMSIKDRVRMIAWAEANDAYLLEDDYCRDFRYTRNPLPPLQSMDQSGRVIYMGTFSKSFSPSLRLNYLLLPRPLLERWMETYAGNFCAVPWLTQVAMARFMREGLWDRHVRRLVAKTRRKYETLIDALHETMGDRISIVENGTGQHLLVEVQDGRAQEELIASARVNNVAVYGTNRYWIAKEHPLASCVLIGFAAIRERDIRPGIETLAQAWFS